MQPDMSPEDTEALGGLPYVGPWLPQRHIVESLEALLAREGLAISATSRATLEAEAHDLYRDLCRLMIRRAEGDYGKDRRAAALPDWRGPQAPNASSAAVPLDDLFTAYIAEVKPAPATQKSWRTNLKHLKDHLGHDDAARVTPEDFVAWKERLLSEEIAPGKVRSTKTVNDKYLAAVRTVFGWAADNRKIAANPTVGIKVRQGKKTKLRSKGLTDAEAHTILIATLAAAPNLPPDHQRARRWVPWLCAYSGARVNEITQLRKEDIFTENGVPVMRITPEAGRTKTNEARVVPLHPHLIEQGFANMVEALPAGPLFYDPSRRRGGTEENPLSKKMGERLAAWVREIGVSDPNVAPNHGWRHRFMSVGRTAGIPLPALDAIQGHAGRTDGEQYGDWPTQALLPHIERLPRYVVTAPKAGSDPTSP
jgi:integrase